MEQSNHELVKDSLAAVGFPKKTFLRKTGEEIEVITYLQNDFGARHQADWVTYIDSSGEEHIREDLTYSLDIKEESALQKTFESLASAQAAVTNLPSPWAARKMELIKSFIAVGNSPHNAVQLANKVVDKLKEDPDFKD